MNELIERLNHIVKELKTLLAISKSQNVLEDEYDRFSKAIDELTRITKILDEKSKLDAQLTEGFLRWAFASDPEAVTQKIENILDTLKLIRQK